MAVVFDASTYANGSAVASLSWTHTPVGTPTAIGLFESGYVASQTDDVYNPVSHAGTPFPTILQYSGPSSDKIFHGLVAGFPNPAAGAQTVILSSTVTGLNTYPLAISVSVTGSDTATCFSNTTFASAISSSSPSCTIVSAVGELVCDCENRFENVSLTTGTGQTITAPNQNIAGESGRGSRKDGAASVTMSYNGAGSVEWVMAVGSFKVGSAAAGFRPKRQFTGGFQELTGGFDA